MHAARSSTIASPLAWRRLGSGNGYSTGNAPLKRLESGRMLGRSTSPGTRRTSRQLIPSSPVEARACSPMTSNEVNAAPLGMLRTKPRTPLAYAR